MNKLTDAEISKNLAAVPEWSEAGEAIQRTYRFANFVDAMKFVNQLADVAEQMNHHPDLLIRYNKVTVTLSTHDAGGITEKDFTQAQRADRLFGASAS